jgi:glyceraldehyde-3-phosphate dehydrogenase/erythrose-4-phosphate dehydrogenase
MQVRPYMMRVLHRKIKMKIKMMKLLHKQTNDQKTKDEGIA